MFEGMENLNLFPTTAADIVVNLFTALLCGLFISWLYRHTYRGPGFSVSFVNSIVLLAMITSIVIMVIGNSLARAFGLVGAMSIIRFRTAIKETRDIVYVFFGLAVGLAAGVGYHKLAILGTTFIGLILYLLSKYEVAGTARKEYLLQFFYSTNGNEAPSYLPILKKHCRRQKVINVKSMEADDTLELSFYVRLKDEKKSSRFMRDLNQAPGVGNINLFFDEEQV
ncbi:MAG: DUF4956 domain-containing protein [FCB group bacterium]|nr:DUF4956 domain-containing protein [FCB group bacterium]